MSAGRTQGTPSNVVNLREIRFARQVELRKPVNNSEARVRDEISGECRLLWVSKCESDLLSTMYEGRVDDAVAMLKAMMMRRAQGGS